MPFNLKVLDLSHHNAVSDFKAVYNSGIRGIIHKATQGTKYIDPNYAKNRQGALDAGLLWGAYHFADASPAEAQLEHFLEAAQLGAGDLGALDYEPNAASTMTLSGAREFLKLYEQKRGTKAVLYSGNLIKETLHGPDSFFGAHRLWLAQYGPIPHTPAAWQAPWLWQFSDGNINSHGIKVPGISGLVDLNSFAGDDAQLAVGWPG